MIKYKVGFIGCGNMGGALVKAISQKISPDLIAVSGKTRVNSDKLADELGVISTTHEDVVKNSKWIFIAVKPQQYPEVLPEIGKTLKERKNGYVIVSMAAGVTTQTICELLGMQVPLIRIMPNTPVSVGKGMTLYAPNELLTKTGTEEFCELMENSGIVDPLEEMLINAGCSVSGCGPAFVFMFIDAMIKAGVKCGLPEDKARIYAIQTIIGSAELLKESQTDPEVLKKAVCSPGGSTIEGVKELETREFAEAVIAAIKASYDKNVLLGQK
ncbi:MAG: pyrroline-5-carboxylate reductase [Lachnospiraceae bacterium]|nr:pyrroline-5-carboxylate reductase [Lachnospiraceae bacterium]